MGSENEIAIRVTAKNDASQGFGDVNKASRDMAGGFDKAGEAADAGEGKAQGFSDTLTGTKDIMGATGEIAKGNLFEGFVMAGQGAADLAGGMASFLIPALKGMTFSSAKARVATLAHAAATRVMTIAQKGLNLAMRMNPLGLIITAVILLAGVLVMAYKKSETFRRIVDGAFRAVQRAASFAFGWVRKNWPLLLAILTGPFGIAVLVIVKKRDAIVGFFKSVPGKIRGFFSGMAGIISGPFSAAFGAIKSMWNSTVGGFGFSVPNWVPKVGGNSFSIPNMARGGIGGGWTTVGERGRELVKLPYGSTVTPNGTTEAMLAGGGSGRTVVLELRSSGSKLDDLLVELLRKAVRVRGGNVQLVIGTP